MGAFFYYSTTPRRRYRALMRLARYFGDRNLHSSLLCLNIPLFYERSSQTSTSCPPKSRVSNANALSKIRRKREIQSRLETSSIMWQRLIIGNSAWQNHWGNTGEVSIVASSTANLNPAALTQGEFYRHSHRTRFYLLSVGADKALDLIKRSRA